mmetsp:Transcript_31058/g.69996  ORF Transcript_31058/g.69996 Transcript_31058/m.69996 type:complete len:324 (+) Transcript_31058:58-1029(+)
MVETQAAHEVPVPAPEVPAIDTPPAREVREAATRRATFRGFTMRSRLSTWRVPKEGTDMPLYVQRASRVKTFGLISVQQTVCLAIMMALRQFVWEKHPLHQTLPVQATYYLLSFVDMLCLMQLWMVRHRFPCNYAALAATTLVAAVLWSLTESALSLSLHVELIFMTCIGMVVTTVLCWLLTREWCAGFSAKVVPVALFVGWLVASVVVLTASEKLLQQDVAVWEPWLACVLLALILLLLVFEAKHVFVRSQPDDSMGILVILNATLMSVVSVPFFCHHLWVSLHAPRGGCRPADSSGSARGYRTAQPRHAQPKSGSARLGLW